MRFPSKSNSLAHLVEELKVEIKTVIDVGVATSTLDLMRVFKTAHHCLIEPLAEHAHIIRENYSSAGIQYTLLQCAASNFSGPTQLEVINPAKPYHSQLLNNTLTQNKNNLRDINAITLDEVMQSHTAPFLIKIDVDGQEKLVLEGLNHTDDVAAVVIEAPLARLPETVEILESKGLKLFDIVDPCYRGAYLQQVDLVFTNGNTNQWIPELSMAELRALPYSAFSEDQAFKDEKRREVLLGIHKGTLRART